MAETNLVVGRGKVYFDRFAPNTFVGTGERYFGNTPTFVISQAATKLDHYNSDSGLKEKDRSVVLQNDVTGKLSTDNINPDNMALFWLGDVSLATVAGAATITQTITMLPGRSYQLGASDAEPAGARNITATSVKILTVAVDAGDYTFHGDTGRIDVSDVTTDIDAEGSDVIVVYAQVAYTRETVIAEGEQIYGALRFIADNPEGLNRDAYAPYCQLTSDGDYNWKGDDWQVMGFNMEILKLANRAKLYIDGRAPVG